MRKAAATAAANSTSPRTASPAPALPAASPIQPVMGEAGIMSRLYAMLSTLIRVARRSLGNQSFSRLRAWRDQMVPNMANPAPPAMAPARGAVPIARVHRPQPAIQKAYSPPQTAEPQPFAQPAAQGIAHLTEHEHHPQPGRRQADVGQALLEIHQGEEGGQVYERPCKDIPHHPGTAAEKIHRFGHMGAQAGRQFGQQDTQRRRLPGGLFGGDGGFPQAHGGRGAQQTDDGIRQIESGKAEHSGKRPRQLSQGGTGGLHLGGHRLHMEKLVGLVGFLQTVIHQGFLTAGNQIVGQSGQSHGHADPQKVLFKGHHQTGQGCRHAGQRQHPAAPQQVGSHAAGHFGQQADHMENALGGADLPQAVSPGSQQGHPDGAGDVEGQDKRIKIRAPQLAAQRMYIHDTEHLSFSDTNWTGVPFYAGTDKQNAPRPNAGARKSSVTASAEQGAADRTRLKKGTLLDGTAYLQPFTWYKLHSAHPMGVLLSAKTAN